MKRSSGAMKTLLLCLLWASVSAQVDRTIEERAAGFAVVQSVVNRIQSTCIFPDDKLYLSRWAQVASADGTKSDTFRSGYFGGIWQVSESKFLSSKQVSSVFLNQVQSTFGINWANVVWADLLKPLYSGLAARLWLQYLKQTQAKDIPSSISDQAVFWAADNTPGTANEFALLANQRIKLCDVVADVAFMVDGSGSVGSANFVKVKQFVSEIVSKLNVGPDTLRHTRVSLMDFSNYVSQKFDFDDYSSFSAYDSAITSLAYQGGGTQTHLALNYLTTQTFLTSKGSRGPGIPKVAVVVTDGYSNSYPDTLASAASLLASGVKVFAVGVGNNLNMQELNAIASNPDCTHVFLLDNFLEFGAFVRQIENRVCDVAVQLNHGTPTNGTLPVNGTKYYTYQIKNSCEVFKISLSYGLVNVYYSSSYQPNNAQYEFHDVVNSSSPKTVFSSLANRTLYITIEALANTFLNFEFLDLNCTCPDAQVPVLSASQFYQCVPVSTTLKTTSTTTRTTPTTARANDGYNCGARNPCSPSVITPNKFHYPHTNPNQFVQCSEWGQCYEMPCPTGLVWEDSIQTCIRVSATLKTISTITRTTTTTARANDGFNCGARNPCSPSVITPNKFHYPHTNPNQFVQCSEWGQCYEMPCPTGLKWEDSIQTCIRVSATSKTISTITRTTTTTARANDGYNCGARNPCSPSVITPNKFHYPHTNPNQFVQCSEWGQCYEMPCPTGLKWKDSIQTCDY